MNEPKASVVSILPYEIADSKPNLYPGTFIIPAGRFESPGILQVTKSVFYVPMAFGAPSLQASSSSFEVANSIVNDYVGALLGINEDCKPGLFVINEVLTQKEILVKHLSEIQKYLAAQRKWFMRLVTMADAEYSRHHQAESISDLQKMAARELNMKDKPWLLDISQLQVNNCPACYSPVNMNAVVCPSCRYVIKPDLYKQMTFAVSLGTPEVQAKA